MSFVFIDDGYTRRARILGVAGIHGSLDFAYRPLLVAEVEALELRLDTMLKRGDGKGATDLVAGTLAKSLVEWDVKDREGKTPKIDKDSVARLAPGLFQKLKQVMQGARSTDPRDDWSEDEWQEFRDSDGRSNLEHDRGN